MISYDTTVLQCELNDLKEMKRDICSLNDDLQNFFHSTKSAGVQAV